MSFAPTCFHNTGRRACPVADACHHTKPGIQDGLGVVVRCVNSTSLDLGVCCRVLTVRCRCRGHLHQHSVGELFQTQTCSRPEIADSARWALTNTVRHIRPTASRCRLHFWMLGWCGEKRRSCGLGAAIFTSDRELAGCRPTIGIPTHNPADVPLRAVKLATAAVCGNHLSPGCRLRWSRRSGGRIGSLSLPAVETKRSSRCKLLTLGTGRAVRSCATGDPSQFLLACTIEAFAPCLLS
ncbi:hypothetical protein EJ04DRAFT_30401 [Polyplosphaeria fusca]|uniref:Uncharacterized protein n=1 Tax=Polyplosphaeria fusca TaxID=682080 RepID=A0A9P4QTH9_9PLEO|nr:hypothetical protein EJ04DRAFT_30401 [Polyplosphaeria fusca]